MQTQLLRHSYLLPNQMRRSIRRVSNTVNNDEISKFNSLNPSDWWDSQGSMSILHRMNPVRIKYIQHWTSVLNPLAKDIQVLDMGCGAGLVTESLARLSHVQSIIGADMAANNIEWATNHALKDPMLRAKLESGHLKYVNQSAESLASEQGARFDIVCALEVIEHVDNASAFLNSLVSLTKPDLGLVFISTINKTRLASLLAVTMAEDVLQLVPKGTHDASKFVSPQDLREYAREAGAEVVDVQGMVYNPICCRWSRSSSMMNDESMVVNYIACIRKL